MPSSVAPEGQRGTAVAAAGGGATTTTTLQQLCKASEVSGGVGGGSGEEGSNTGDSKLLDGNSYYYNDVLHSGPFDGDGALGRNMSIFALKLSKQMKVRACGRWSAVCRRCCMRMRMCTVCCIDLANTATVRVHTVSRHA